MSSPVLLVAMPWKDIASPSIQLGLIKSLLAERGIDAHVGNYFLHFAQHLATGGNGIGRRFAMRAYRAISESGDHEGLGDWTFAVPPYFDASPERDAAYGAFLRRAKYTEAKVSQVFAMRALVPSFLETCVADVLARRPKAVGFTTVFRQNVPSLVLAKMIKQRAPDITIVFGGANCEGVMGEALAREFPFVDVVVRGEADHLVGDLFEQILAGRPIESRPGLCIRRPDGVEVCELQVGGTTTPLDELPDPNYDEFFAELPSTVFADELDAVVHVPFETSRGCWWGAKHHCTFCGLNGMTMAFRRKSEQRAYETITALATRYRRVDLVATDNIIDMQYFRELLPRLAAEGGDYRIFYETKANLSWERLVAMRAAGVTKLQPGIESLSSDVLRIMNKGITALQNIRLLKWAATLEIDLSWNLLFGFPKEKPEDYARTAELIPLLHHLQPPFGVGQLRLDRFSPFHEQPEALGLEIADALPFYYHIYDAEPARVRDLAYYFAFRHLDGRNPLEYIQATRRAVSTWRALWHEHKPTLTFRRGPDFMIIADRRSSRGNATQTTLDGTQATIHALCESGISIPHILDHFAARGGNVPSEAFVERTLAMLVERGLAIEEEGKYLTLALPFQPWRYSPDAEAELARDREPAPSNASLASIR